jgi:hypothetical protein
MGGVTSLVLCKARETARTRVGSGASSASARLMLIGMAFMEQSFGVD